MTDHKPLNKVTAYVTRRQADKMELLVFRHPGAGVQLPAGTVEDGEAPEDAILREVAEETGLLDAQIVRLLAVEEIVLPPNQRAVRKVSPLLAEPQPDSTQLDMVGRSGFFLEAAESTGGYCRVTHERHVFKDDVFVPITTVVGWMPEGVLTDRVVRHHYEIRTSQPTPERWTQTAEDEHEFELYWMPLRAHIGLAASNQAWLNLVMDKLNE